MSSSTHSTGPFRPAGTEPAVEDNGELQSLFRSEAEEPGSTGWPSQAPRRLLDEAPRPAPAVVKTGFDLPLTPDRRGPASRFLLAIPVLALVALGAALYYVYAEPVRQSPSLPLVPRVFGLLKASTVASLHLLAPEPAVARGAGAAAPIPSGVTAPSRTAVRTPRATGTVAPRAGPLAGAVGLLFVNARPWADVWIDGQPAGTTPLANLRVTLGAHEIVWKHPHLGERRQQVTVTRESPTRIGMNLQVP